MNFRVQLAPMNTHKLHVFVQLGLMIAMDYQDKNVQVSEMIQNQNKPQVVQTQGLEVFELVSVATFFC